MPFHIGGHKPKAGKKFRFGLKERSGFAALGALFMIGGVYRMMHGGFVISNRFHQLVFSPALIATIIPFFLLSLTPSRWVEQATNYLTSNPRARKVIPR